MMNRIRTTVTVTAGLALAATMPVAASADTFSHSDPRGDVVVAGDDPQPAPADVYARTWATMSAPTCVSASPGR